MHPLIRLTQTTWVLLVACGLSYTDLSPTLRAASPTPSPSVSPSPSATYSIFGNATPNAIELGVKFQSSQNGSITGIRFYRSVTNPAGYSVHLYDGGGLLLASANPATESAPVPGWQSATFSSPVAIMANTTYVASYYTSNGDYAAISPRGLTNAVTNGPLTALASSMSGGNGVYRYGTNGTLPTQTYQDTNYYVDVMFVPGSSGGGTVIPSGRTTPWNPGIRKVDLRSSESLGADGIPVRTSISASLSAPSGDATSLIQNAINDSPARSVVLLGPGTFTISSTLQMKSDVVLRGSGSQGGTSGGTTIYLSTNSGSVIAFGTAQDAACYQSNFGPAYNLTENAANGSNTLTISSSNASNINLSGGPVYALVDEIDDSTINAGDCSSLKRVSNRSAIQTVEISQNSSGVLTLSSPLHWNYNSASQYSAQISIVSRSMMKWAGLEHVYLQNGNNTAYDGAYAGGIDMSNTAYCWVKDVQTDGTIGGMHVTVTGGYRNVIRDSYFHNSSNYGYEVDCYGIVIRCGTSETLVENNISRYMNKPVLFDVSGGGNVVGYNYIDNSWATPAVWQEANIDNHCSFPHMELIEGNWAPHMGASTTHGNAGYLTYFRNYSSSDFASPAVVGQAVQQSANVTAIEFDGSDIGMNVVGNVLGCTTNAAFGLPNDDGQAICPTPAYDTYTTEGNAIFQLGAGAIAGNGINDVAVTTLYRNGNFDTFHGSVQWLSSRVTLPSSLYLSGRPHWWPAGEVWPWTGFDLSPMVNTLPAKQRSDALRGQSIRRKSSGK